MDFGPQAISIFVTLFLILAAMGVALIVDLLKGNNEQLRELAIELKAKKDAAERHLESLENHTAALLQRPVLAAGTSAQALLPENTEAASTKPATARSRAEAPRNTEATQRTEEQPKEPGFQQAVRKGRGDQAAKREMSPAVAAVAESVAARMAAGNMATAAAKSVPVAPAPVPEPAPAPAPVFVAPPAAAAAATASGLNPEIVPVDIKTGIFQAPAEARKDWSRILTNRKHDAPAPIHHEEVSSSGLPAAAAAAASESTGSVLPSGFHDYAILRKAAAAGASLQGMVVAIGLNQLDMQKMAEVSDFVQSLLEPEDFGCQSGSDEFVLVCLGDGQTAQRRLSAIAEKLWDFQLRSMGRLNVQFAWGGMEARSGEKLNDAVASAIDQMTETRRARRGSSAQIARAV